MKRKIIYISAVAAVALAILIVSLVNRFKDRNKYTDVVIMGHDENNMYFTVGSLSYSYNESDGVKKIKKHTGDYETEQDVEQILSGAELPKGSNTDVRDMITDGKAVYYWRKLSEDTFKLYAYIPKTGENRPVCDYTDMLDADKLYDGHTNPCSLYMWKNHIYSEGYRSDILMFDITYDDDGYPVSVTFNKTIFEFDK